MLGGEGTSIPGNNNSLAAKLVRRLQGTIVSDTTWGAGPYGGLLLSNGSPTSSSTQAYYWTAVSVSASHAYFLNYRAGNVLPQNYVPKFYGFMLRCVRE
jgi:hypothetical protein